MMEVGFLKRQTTLKSHTLKDAEHLLVIFPSE